MCVGLVKAMEKQGCSLEKIGSTLSREQFLHILAREAQEVPVAKYNQNGFWSDHWTYNMDLLDNFLTIYPDKEFELLFGLEPIPFFLSPSTVQPRSKKYRKLSDGTVIQVDAVLDGANIAKPREQLITAARSGNGYVEDPLGNNNAWHLDAAGYPMVVSARSSVTALHGTAWIRVSALSIWPASSLTLLNNRTGTIEACMRRCQPSTKITIIVSIVTPPCT